MPLNAPVLVRNTEGGPTVLSDLQTKEFVEWAGANDDMGNDVQAVPESFLQNVNFLRCVQRGILVIENADDNPEIAVAIEKQNAAWVARREQAKKKAAESIDQQANNDLVSVRCVGPGGRGGQCDNTVPVKDKQRADKPPLCSTHEGLAPQYVRNDNVEGDSTVHEWKRVTMAPREREQVSG
jgi:hypothetical protein